LIKLEKISIIITTFNRSDNVIEIIKLLNKQLNFSCDLEIIICDSNSINKLKIINHIKNYNSLKVKYLNLKKNHQGYKRNKGASFSTGNYLIFLDDDCFPEINFLSNYYKKLKLNKNRQIYCGSVEYVNKPLIKNLIKFRNNRSIKFEDNRNKNLAVKNFVTMNMGFNKHLFRNYNKFFDLRFNYYGFEDFELAYRLKNRGFNISIIKSEILHKDFRNFKTFLTKFYFMGRFGIKDICQININAAKKSIFYKIYKNKIVVNLLKLPMINLVLYMIEKSIVYLESKFHFYLPLIYKSGIFIAFIRGLKNQNNDSKDIKIYNNNLKNWYE
jgi:glycosyltransferase involved in cell wall biosynthesis